MREMDFKMERPGLLEEGQEVTVTNCLKAQSLFFLEILVKLKQI